MTTAVHLDYFYGDKVKMKRFIRMPRALLDEVYGDISAEVKYLYTLMLDRVSLSMRKGWRDNDGRVYIYFTLKDAERLLKVGKNKAVNLFKRLEELGLIRRRKQGQGKPARVYVRRLVKGPKENAEGAAPDFAEVSAPEPETAPEAEAMKAAPSAEAAPMPEPTPEAPETLPKEIEIPVEDVKLPAPATEEERSRSATLAETAPAAPDGIAGLLADCVVGVRRLGDILSQRLANSGGVPANANVAGIAVNANGAGNAANAAAPVARTETTGKPVYEQSAYYFNAYEGDRWKNASMVRKEILDNLDLSIIRNKYAMEQIWGYVEIMVQACCEQTPTVRINGTEYSRATVRRRMCQLDATHLEYVYDCMKECAPKVHNLRAYILTALFNSYDTLDIYYDAKVKHDMAESRKRVMEEYGDYFDED